MRRGKMSCRQTKKFRVMVYFIYLDHGLKLCLKWSEIILHLCKIYNCASNTIKKVHTVLCWVCTFFLFCFLILRNSWTQASIILASDVNSSLSAVWMSFSHTASYLPIPVIYFPSSSYIHLLISCHSLFWKKQSS